MTVHVRAVSLLLVALLLLPLLPLPPAPAEPAGPGGVFEFDIYLKAPGDPWHAEVHRAFYELTQYRCELPNQLLFQRIDEGGQWRYRCIFNSGSLTRYTGTAISSLTQIDVALQQNTYYRYDFVVNKEENVMFNVRYGWIGGMYFSKYAFLSFYFPAYDVVPAGTPIQYSSKTVRIRYVDNNNVEYDFGTLTIERVAANHLRITLQRSVTNTIIANYLYVNIGGHRLLYIDFDASIGYEYYTYAELSYDEFNRVVINIYLQP